MQTLKTAAIVVLLMTVMYGAYVSLTTPPEPLPGEAEEMLVIDEEGSLAIDVGLPASLGDLDFGEASAADSAAVAASGQTSQNAGSQIAGVSQGAQSSAAAGARDGSPSASGPDFASGPELASMGVAASGADTELPSGYAPVGSLNNSGGNGSGSGVTAVLGDQSIPGPVAARGAADSESVAGDRQPQPQQSQPQTRYPRTDNTFEMPDPNGVASGFGSDRSSTFAMPNESGNLALASGTSEVPPKASDLKQPSPQSGERSGRNLGLANAIRIADRQYAEDKRKDALATLSLFYDTPNLSGEQRSELLSRLDPLAREVIYSKRHLLEQPYRVGQNETLMDVAKRFDVPWQLLANINQIEDPVTILPGTELKVVQGPFRAEVNLTLKELTLFLGDLYAGRFPIGVGNDPQPKPGTFTVQDKQTERTFYDAVGNPVSAGSRDNPYGEVWMDLGGNFCIHGSPSTTEPTEKGCISLAADYADDLYGILSQGSSVTIRR